MIEDFTRKEHRAERKRVARRDRSKYKKTDIEKWKRLKREEAERKLEKKDLLRGRVLAISPEGISVEHEGNVSLCTLRGVLKKENTRLKNLVAVGDFVLFEDEAIAFVEERRTILSRAEHLHRRQEQLIAANIDQVLITVSVVEPPLKPFLIDRYIIATRKGNMDPVIVINKIDLLTKEFHEEKNLLETLIETYQKLDIPVIPLSAETGEGMDFLKQQMQGKASVFSGQSGVGKSSLINTMTGLKLPIGEIIRKTRKGVHTTTTTHLIPLEFGGWCIDTPGIRSFGVWDLKKEDLSAYFPEIREIGQHCKYPNCTHSHEPGCAIEEAIKKGEVSRMRLDSYLKLLEDIA